MLNRLLYFKKVNMSFSECLSEINGDITLSQIYFNRVAQRTLERICRKDKKIRVLVVFVLAGILTLNTVVVACAVDTGKIDTMGRTLLTIVQSIGYWFCIIMAAKEILTSLMQNQAKEVGGIILKHVLAFGGFFALPWIFDLIKELLG